jgi:hypothetical protein
LLLTFFISTIALANSDVQFPVQSSYPIVGVGNTLEKAALDNRKKELGIKILEEKLKNSRSQNE